VTPKVYFDTSALLKEFYTEVGLDLIDKLASNAKQGKLQIISSIWSINESVAAVDRKYRKGEMNDSDVQTIIATLTDRIITSTEQGSFIFKRLSHAIISNSLILISIFHISPSDALHLQTAFSEDCDYFVVHDNELVKRVLSSGYKFEGIEIVNLGVTSDRQNLIARLQI
jgi:predicted nucleic acid-binding protein